MKRKSVSPIMTWLFWSTLVLGTFLTVTWEYFVAGFTADSSKITWLILIFFVYGFIGSARVALHLQTEYKSVKDMDEEQRVGDPNASDAAAMFDSALERIRRGERIEVRTLISAYAAKLKSRVDNINVISSMLITVGLLGTVVGLIITVTGLGQVLQSNGADFSEMKAGLNRTVSGMGTAFYTTFFGALLGGVVLKVLASEMRKSTQVLVADVLRFGELFVAPQFQKAASETLTKLEDRIVGLNEQLGSLSESFGVAVQTLDSKQTVLSDGLEHLVSAVTRANDEASERAEKLVGMLSSSIEETSRQADERLQAFTAAMGQSNKESTERTHALLEAIDKSLDGTNERADERLSGITTALEQTNSEATERTHALTAAITESIEATNSRADERLSLTAETVGKSVESTSSHAAQQLESVAAAVQSSLEESNRKADERVEALISRLGELIGQVDDKASQRLEVLTGSVSETTAETNRMADERLQAMIKSVEENSQAAMKKAEEQLTGFVENVDRSIESSRKDAEDRLNTRAAELAGKLNEAASMLSGLATPSGEPSIKMDEDEG